jgi:tryptophan 2,3-dioxygenase
MPQPQSVVPEPSAPYGQYMRVSELLDLQRPAAVRVHPDELHFQTVHQVTELLLQCITDDLTRAGQLVDGDAALPAERLVARATTTMTAARAVLDVLGAFTIADYNVIRRELGSSSAAESPGWAGLAKAAAALNLAFARMTDRLGVDLVSSLEGGDHADPIHRLATAMMDADVALSEWRWRHYCTATRLIGLAGTGTQGTHLQVLSRHAHEHAFARVWAAAAAASTGGQR